MIQSYRIKRRLVLFTSFKLFDPKLAEKKGNLNFGERFVGCKFHHEIKLENKGRRSHVILWANEALLPPSKIINESLVAQKKAHKDLEDPLKFTVTPFRSVIKPNQTVTCIIEGLSREVGLLRESLICKSLSGPKKQTMVLKCDCIANFVVPLVECAVQKLHFRYDYEENKDPTDVLQENLVFKNVSKLPLTAHLRSVAPFYIDQPDWVLQDDETATVQVSFNPSYRGDKQSVVHYGKVIMHFQEADKTMSTPLIGEVNYPNLELEVDQIDFGCVLNKTTARRSISVTNSSKIRADIC